MECTAIIWHGPGHMSSTRCERTDTHKIRRCIVKGFVLNWKGQESMTGFFDESPIEEEE